MSSPYSISTASCKSFFRSNFKSYCFKCLQLTAQHREHSNFSASTQQVVVPEAYGLRWVEKSLHLF